MLPNKKRFVATDIHIFWPVLVITNYGQKLNLGNNLYYDRFILRKKYVKNLNVIYKYNLLFYQIP